MWTNLQCYAILNIQDVYRPGYFEKEFFNCTAGGFDTNNVEGLIEYIKSVLGIEEFEIYWTILDPDHFCEIHNL